MPVATAVNAPVQAEAAAMAAYEVELAGRYRDPGYIIVDDLLDDGVAIEGMLGKWWEDALSHMKHDQLTCTWTGTAKCHSGIDCYCRCHVTTADGIPMAVHVAPCCTRCEVCGVNYRPH